MTTSVFQSRHNESVELIFRFTTAEHVSCNLFLRVHVFEDRLTQSHTAYTLCSDGQLCLGFSFGYFDFMPFLKAFKSFSISQCQALAYNFSKFVEFLISNYITSN